MLKLIGSGEFGCNDPDALSSWLPVYGVGCPLSDLKASRALAPARRRRVDAAPARDEIGGRVGVAASAQETVVDSQVGPTLRAAEAIGPEQVLVAGGVAFNRRLREVLAERSEVAGLGVLFTPPERCTDNAEMIGGLGWHLMAVGRRAEWDLKASPR